MKDLLKDINRLRKERKAVILAHTYQPAEIQELADYVGDSYGLSVKASQLEDADVIVFCGVSFMAETAAILNPRKTVLMPEPSAGCPMADTITAEQLRAFKAEHPGAPVVCYVNSTAEVKAESDICCTSSNALKVVKSLGDVPEILFVPDQYLGHFVEQQLGRKLVCWNGGCPVHHQLTAKILQDMKAKYPDFKVMVHPETTPEAQAEADHILATGPMIELVRKSDDQKYLVGTEEGILHALKEAAPQKTFVHVSPLLVCEDMKKTTLEKVKRSLETMETVVKVPVDIAAKARKSIEAMLKL
jgi:quinolinate synthase